MLNFTKNGHKTKVNIVLKSQKLSLQIRWSFLAFRPRFAGRYDPQSRDLSQLPSGYNFAVKPATNDPSSLCWMYT